MKLSNKILNLRKEKGLSQEELAEKIGVSRQAVSRWEGGAAQPDAANLLQLSRLFQVTADYLLDDDREREEAPALDPHAKTKRKERIAGCVAALGALGIFILYILSRIIEVMVPHITYENGEKLYTWKSDLTGHSYLWFIREYDLELLALLFYGLLLGGLIYGLAHHRKVKALMKKGREKLRFAGKK